MNREYNCKVSSNNSRRLLKNCKYDRGSLFLPHPVHIVHEQLPEMELRLLLRNGLSKVLFRYMYVKRSDPTYLMLLQLAYFRQNKNMNVSTRKRCVLRRLIHRISECTFCCECHCANANRRRNKQVFGVGRPVEVTQRRRRCLVAK